MHYQPRRPVQRWFFYLLFGVLVYGGLLGLRPGVQAADEEKPAVPLLAKKWRLNLIRYMDVPQAEEAEKGIRTGLHRAGLVEGRDYELTVRSAQGDMAMLSTLIDAAVTDNADLLLLVQTQALEAARQRAPKLPMVFIVVANPFALGAGHSDTDHLPNVTGYYTLNDFGVMLPLIREILPSARRIGTLFSPAEQNSVQFKDELIEAAGQMGISVEAIGVPTISEVSDASRALLSRNIDAICQIRDNLTARAFPSIGQAARQARVPIFSFLRSQEQQGATIVVGHNFLDGAQGMAAMAVRIMRGESPAAIPFQHTSGSRLIVNLKAAQAIGLHIPPSVLQRADEVIDP
jgi:ABC-type uncharacterized transport system substrate-binding protein